MAIILAAGAVLSVGSVAVTQSVSQAGDVHVGTIDLTKAYVSENHILQRLGIEVARNSKVTQMSDAAIYRGLMEGKIDLGSVLALPQDVGAKDFEGTFSTPPQVMTLGHLAVSACVSTKRPVSHLTVEQVGRIISGEITDWQQLGAGGGKINPITDQRAIELIAAVTGIKPAKNLRKIDEGRKAIAIVGDADVVLTSSELSDLDFSKMERVALVPIGSDKDNAMLPSLANIQNGSYPLARPWRLILRPDAPKTAAKVMAVLADVEKGGDFDPFLRFWLVHPAASPISNHIRIGSIGWQDELAAAAKAYHAKHPEVTITFSKDYLNVPTRLLRGEIDLANYTGEFLDHVGGPDYQKFGKGFPEESVERTIGYWPLAVAVHPANPMKSITVEQLRRLLSDPDARWPDIGRATDGRIRLYTYEASAIARALGSGEGSESSSEPLSLRGADKHRLGVTLPDRGIPNLADDPDGIAIWYHDKKLAASGYKILPVIANAENQAISPTDTAALASGRYVLRTPLKILIRASAQSQVKAFVDWLSTADAAEAFKSAADDRSSSRWPAAHVSEADSAVASRPALRQAATTASAATSAGSVDGAVAVLPTEPLSTVFRMANPSHHAAYERAITDAIQADGQLKIVDRTQLSRVLNERQMQVLGLEDRPAKPIVSADVLVISHLVTEDLKTFLRIRATHGPTGGLLGELKLPINPADPATFDPPLDQAVRRWWPEVLGRLRDSRDKPSWAVLDVYPSTLELLEASDALRAALQTSLAEERLVFAPGDSTFDDAQQEMLLRILGLASPTGGRFTPAADYIVDARLLSPYKLELRLRNAALKVLAEETFSGDAQALQTAAKGWLSRQIAANPRRPIASSMPAGDIDEWARQQAGVELDIWRQLKTRAGVRAREAGIDRLRDSQVRALTAAAVAHARRAAQLDPTNEEAAYEAIPALTDFMVSWTTSVENTISLPAYVAPLERFLQAFPRSRYYGEILYRHATTCVYAGSRDKFPTGANARLRISLMRHGLDSYARYMELYRIQGSPSPEHQAVMCFEHYLYHVQTYVELAQASELELDGIVADWSRRFDGYPDKAVHSDFVRLVILKHKKDRQGFIDVLTKMQQRWPDPKNPQWLHMTDSVDRMIFALFRSVDSSTSSFQLWHRGLRGIGDIPKVGYKLQDDEPHFGNVMLLFRFPSEAAGLREAFRQAGEAYRKKQPNVRLSLISSPNLLKAVEEQHGIIVIMGDVPAVDLTPLAEIYRTKDLPLRRFGSYSPTPGSPARALSLLMPPARGGGDVLDDFLRFLQTPAGQDVLAKHGIRQPADAAASRPQDLNVKETLDVKHPASAASN